MCKFSLSLFALFLGLSFSQGALGETTLDSHDGLKFDWGSSRSLTFGTRVHYDSVGFNSDVTPLDDNDDFRRARLIGKFEFDNWRVRADYDFGISDGWKSTYIQYRGIDHVRITLGNQVAPFSLEDLTGSNDLPLAERSLGSALSPGLLNGLSARTWGKKWTLAAGVFEDELSDQDRRRAKGNSVVVRATYTPIVEDDSFIHFGIAHESRRIDDNEAVRIRARPETRLTNTRLVDSGNLTSVDDITVTGFELAAAINSFHVQVEYSQMSVDHIGGSADFSGGYLLIGAFLTGENYRYSRSRGVVRGVEPKRNWGAIEVSARQSSLDLSDSTVLGGEQKQTTIALTWFAKENFRIALNFSRFDVDPNSNGVTEDGTLWLVRAQAAI